MDLIWDDHDVDGSGYLDKLETKDFVKATLKLIDETKLEQFETNFEAAYKKIDVDGDEQVSKAEMCEFILEIFTN